MSKQLQILKYIWFGKKAYLYGWEEIFLEGNIVCFSKRDKKCHYKWDKHTCNSSQTVIHIAYIDKILYHIGFILFFLWKWTRHPINIDNMIIRDSALYQLCHVIRLQNKLLSSHITHKSNVLSTHETPFHFRAISTCMRKSKRCVYKRVVKLKMLKYLNFLLHFDDKS